MEPIEGVNRIPKPRWKLVRPSPFYSNITWTLSSDACLGAYNLELHIVLIQGRSLHSVRQGVMFRCISRYMCQETRPAHAHEGDP